MLRPVATRPPLLVLVACLLAGCGSSGPSDEERVRATLAEFRRATEARDYQALCDHVFAPKLVQTVKQIGLPCEVALQKGFEDVKDPRLTVGSIEVEDDKASAEVRSSAAGESPSQDTVQLVRVGDDWRIASLGSSAP
jgi:ketosteroid isomerase-like protein